LACECFGAWAVHPAITTVLDAAVLALLAWTRPRDFTGQLRRELQISPQVGNRLSFAVVVLAGICLRQYTFEASRLIAPHPLVQELPPGRVGTPVTGHVRLANNSDSPVTVVGGGTSCRCLTLTGLPVAIPANTAVDLRVKLSRPDKPGRISQRIVYYLDAPEQYTVSVSVWSTVSAEKELL